MQVGDIIPAHKVAAMPPFEALIPGEGIWVATGEGSFRGVALDDGSMRIVEFLSTAALVEIRAEAANDRQA